MSEIEVSNRFWGSWLKTIELMTDETAELVDKYHRQYTNAEYHQKVVERLPRLSQPLKNYVESPRKFLIELIFRARKDD